MLKYTDSMVTFLEVPNEISLCVNISGCPIQCSDCHSKELWKNIGKPLNRKNIGTLIRNNGGISCFCLMGGDADEQAIVKAASSIIRIDPTLKIAWYSGKESISSYMYEYIYKERMFDYVKIGPYIAEKGPLNFPTTNQRMYKFYENGTVEDITYLFWKSNFKKY